MVALTEANRVEIIITIITAGAAVMAAWISSRNRKELKPNGGSSMRDAIDRLDRRATVHDEQLSRIDGTVTTIADALGRIERRQTGHDE